MLSTPSHRYEDGNWGSPPPKRARARLQDGFVGCDVCAMAQVLGLVVVAPCFTPHTPYELAQCFLHLPIAMETAIWGSPPPTRVRARLRAGRFRWVRRVRNGPSAWTGGCCTICHPTNIISTSKCLLKHCDRYHDA